MNVRELKKELFKLSADYDECEVILQKDSEGNGYSPLDCVDAEAIYEPDSSYSGEVYSLNWSADQMDMSENEWEETKRRLKKCVVLAPTN